MRPGANEPSDAELVSRVVRGDRAAFGELYDRTAPHVQRFLVGLQLHLGHHEIEDAVQETFLRLHGALPRFDAARQLRPFALGIARRVALELERRARTPAKLRSLPGRSVEAADDLERIERDALVARALVALPEDERAVIVLRFVNELTMQDVADALECSIPTARARLKEATARFQRALGRAGVAPEDVPS